MIVVNEQEMAWEAGMTVQDVLDRRKFSFPLVIVRVNGELVRRADFDTHTVEDGDRVQVLHLMSGG